MTRSIGEPGKSWPEGFRAADAVHVAAAERLGADVLVTTDDRLARRGKRLRKQLHVRVLDVLSFLGEIQP
jgi:predicted nucleic acid-binding protein